MLNNSQSLGLAPLDPLATFVHDLSNPLTLIQVNLELLEQNLSPDSFLQVKKYIHRAKSGIHHAQQIAHVVRHSQSTKSESIVEVTSELERLAQSYQQRLEQEQIHLILELEPKLQVHGEVARFVAIFDNLLRNAFEAFTGYDKHPKAIKIEAGRRHEQLIVRVSDNGSGMSSETQKFIFDYGFTTKGANRGKGLAIVIHNLYSHFDGQIDFVSGAKEGTIFELVFHAVV